MARSESKRQKRLAKQKAKRNQKHQELQRQRQMGLAERLAQFESAPVVDCLINTSFEKEGMANLLIGRKASSGEMALASFLVDTYCLGVKDCYAQVVTPAVYRNHVERFSEQFVRPIDPPSARRLIEDALAFAQSLGLSPHPDFRKARAILNGIDPEQARETFPMGKDGKPFFIAGPHDSPAKCRQILSTLAAKCGPDESHYMLPMQGPGDILPGERLVAIDHDEDDEDDPEDV